MTTASARVASLALTCGIVLFAPGAHAMDAPHDAMQCGDCHVPHAASYPTDLKNVCQACHFAGGPARARATHSSKTTDAKYGNWDLDCWACHDPHTQWQNRTYGTTYGKLVYTNLNAQVKQVSPTDPGPYYTPISILRTVTSSNLQFTSNTGFVDTDAIASDDVCRVCHSSTSATGFPGVYTQTANTHYDFGAASQPGGTCTSCHPHASGFRVEGCTNCHTTAQPSAGQYRRAVTGAGNDFVKATHHVSDGTTAQIVGDGDCLVCHANGSHRSNPAPSGKGVLLQNPDVATASVSYGGTGASAESMCVGCHDADGASAFGGTKPFSDGRVVPNVTYAWTGSSHQATTKAAVAAEKCMACHGGADPTDATATYNRNMHGATGPSLLTSKINGSTPTNMEEGVCFVCHNGTSSTNILGQFSETFSHPTTKFSGRHKPSEDATNNPAAYGFSATTDQRHAECPDCHNPHGATPANRLNAVSRVVPTNGAAGTTPTFSFLLETDVTTPSAEYQVCFKCHSSWTTLRPDTYYTGVVKYRDKSLELNPANESFHPVEGAGKATSTQMVASLNGGTGLPHLTTSSVLACTDCHNNDSIPTTVSTLASYTALPKGPHGSTAAAGFSPFLLRAAYRTTAPGAGTSYAASSFAFCFICHSSAPFADTSKNTRSDTVFRLHGFHMAGIAGAGVPGTVDPNNPAVAGSGGGDAICKECHYQLHSTKLTYWVNGRSNSRLVNFSPSITGSNGTGSPVWNPSTRTCSLTCHGMNHSPENY